MAVVVSQTFYLVGTWVNCMLFMLELTLVVRYFQHSARRTLHKICIGAIFAADLCCTVTICTETYVVVLLFLCVMYFTLTMKRVISAILVSSIVVHLVFSYVSAILMLTNSMGWAILFSKIGAISCAVTDSMIAAALLYTFIRMEKSTSRESTHSPIFPLFFFSQGRVYALTILGNFALGTPGPRTTTEPVPRDTHPTRTGVVFHLTYMYSSSADEQLQQHITMHAIPLASIMKYQPQLHIESKQRIDGR
ncbi:hypothetical protein B0H13DRAFT_2062335 [Mycena leptocephala]|nr:hypothetical protein B0H13DRAFT_2062335 [Mycena leptocephala]